MAGSEAAHKLQFGPAKSQGTLKTIAKTDRSLFTWGSERVTGKAIDRVLADHEFVLRYYVDGCEDRVYSDTEAKQEITSNRPGEWSKNMLARKVQPFCTSEQYQNAAPAQPDIIASNENQRTTRSTAGASKTDVKPQAKRKTGSPSDNSAGRKRPKTSPATSVNQSEKRLPPVSRQFSSPQRQSGGTARSYSSPTQPPPSVQPVSGYISSTPQPSPGLPKSSSAQSLKVPKLTEKPKKTAAKSADAYLRSAALTNDEYTTRCQGNGSDLEFFLKYNTTNTPQKESNVNGTLLSDNVVA